MAPRSSPRPATRTEYSVVQFSQFDQNQDFEHEAWPSCPKQMPPPLPFALCTQVTRRVAPLVVTPFYGDRLVRTSSAGLATCRDPQMSAKTATCSPVGSSDIHQSHFLNPRICALEANSTAWLLPVLHRRGGIISCFHSLYPELMVSPFYPLSSLGLGTLPSYSMGFALPASDLFP